ncbi:helix-turn-helix domain-containing protein [Ohtaekwangia koreensis]|uniref:AraC-type DNA-binding protein n=1 Tax=Ohtaekwangia koreensis TaxID=688867 RepID=A0A1T5KMV6_9BACT|nr:AraC family transcriptional regulator [Ohtaekwangia koreensis]SKC65037.1 AraC-type DNA-binding protein [Ohtaekwangia koreensis]
MNAYQLPEFLNGGKACDVHIHHYRSDKLYMKNKVVLNQNLVCILLNGTKEVFGSQQSVKINNTEILLISAGNVVMWESIAEGNKLESLLLFFSNTMLKEFCAKYSLSFSDNLDTSQAVMSIKKDNYISSFQESIQALRQEDLSMLGRLKIEELFVYLSMKYRSPTFCSFVRNALHAVGENKLRDVVEMNMTKGLSIDELAFLCNMSISTFKRHFEKTFKCSPKKYFTDKRMERAKQMLLLEKRPSDIYHDLRYQNLSSFSTEFKKHFGVSPKQFQRSSLAGV